MPTFQLKYRSVAKWLGRVDPHWGLNQVLTLERWCRWLEGRGEVWDPDELVRVQGLAVGQDRFRLLDLLEEWVQASGLRVNTKSANYNYVRSFFLHNRSELPRDLSFRLTGGAKYVGTLGVGDLRMVLDRCSPGYRAMFLSMFMGGMGMGELMYWSEFGVDSTLEQVESGCRLLRVDLPGRKRGRGVHPFYTFVGRDGLKALRVWLEVRPRRASTLFLNQFGAPAAYFAVGNYWRRQLVALGLRKSGERYGKNPHELRDLFRTRWQKSGADGTAAEFFMGHVVDSNDYNKAFSDVDYASEQYLKAERWLNVASEDPEKVPVKQHLELLRDNEDLRRLLREKLDRLESIERRIDRLPV